MGILEKISEIEKEIARTQKNKGLYIFVEYNWISNLEWKCTDIRL